MKKFLKLLTASVLALIIALPIGLFCACDKDEDGEQPIEFDKVVCSVSIGAIELMNSKYAEEVVLPEEITKTEKSEENTLTPPTEEDILEIKRHFVFSDKQTEILNSDKNVDSTKTKIKSGVYKYEINIDDDIKFDYTRTEIRKNKCILIDGKISKTIDGQEIEYLLSASFEADLSGKKIVVEIKAPEKDENGEYVKENESFIYHDVSFKYETTDISSKEYRGKYRHNGNISFRADLSFLIDEKGNCSTKFITMPKDGIIEYVFNKVDETNYQVVVINKLNLIDTVWVDIVKGSEDLTVTYHTPTATETPQ